MQLLFQGTKAFGGFGALAMQEGALCSVPSWAIFVPAWLFGSLRSKTALVSDRHWPGVVQWSYSVAVFLESDFTLSLSSGDDGKASVIHLSHVMGKDRTTKLILTQMHKELPVRRPCRVQIFFLFLIFVWILPICALMIKSTACEVEVSCAAFSSNIVSSFSIQTVIFTVISQETLLIKPVWSVYMKKKLCLKNWIKSSTRISDASLMAPSTGRRRDLKRAEAGLQRTD